MARNQGKTEKAFWQWAQKTSPIEWVGFFLGAYLLGFIIKDAVATGDKVQ